MAQKLYSALGYLGTAGLAFFLGGKFTSNTAPLAGGTEIKGGPVALPSAEVASAEVKAGTMNVPALNALKDVEDFIKRFASESGPLSVEAMKVALGEVLQEGDPVKSSLMFSLLLDKMTPESAPEMLKEIQAKVPGFEGFRYVGLLSYKWGEMDGPATMAAMMKQTGPGRFVGVAGLAGWAGKDPDGAAKWLASQEFASEREGEMLSRGLISGLARTNPDAAAAHVAKIATADQRSRMTQVLAEEQIKRGLDSASSWAVNLADPEMRKGAFEAVADQLFRADKAQAASYVTQNANQPHAVNAAGELARRLAEQNPQDALQFTSALPNGETRQKAYSGTFRQWAGKNPEEASTMLQNMPAGADRDSAAAGLAPAVTKDAPAAAIAWAEVIQDPAMKQNTLTEVLRTQYQQDPDAAMGYMSNKGWTKEQQDSVRVSPEGDRRGWGPR